MTLSKRLRCVPSTTLLPQRHSDGTQPADSCGNRKTARTPMQRKCGDSPESRGQPDLVPTQQKARVATRLAPADGPWQTGRLTNRRDRAMSQTHAEVEFPFPHFHFPTQPRLTFPSLTLIDLKVRS